MSQLNVTKSDVAGPDRRTQRSANLLERLRSLVSVGQDHADFDTIVLHLMADLLSADSGFMFQEAADGGGFVQTSAVDNGGAQDLDFSHDDLRAWADEHKVQQHSLTGSDAKSGVVFSVLLPSKPGSPAQRVLAVLVVRNATPFAIALAHERLQLIAAVCQAKTGSSVSVAGLTVSPVRMMQLAQGLLGSESCADRDRAFVDGVCSEFALSGLVLARIARAGVSGLTFAAQGQPHSASQTAADCKAAIRAALSRTGQTPSKGLEREENTPGWCVEIIQSENQPVAAFALPRDADGGDAESSAKTLRAVAGLFSPFIAAAARRGTIGEALGDFGRRRRPMRWMLAACLAATSMFFIPWPDRVSAPFRVVSEERRVVTAPFDGVLEAVLVDVDDRVVKGQTELARLSTRELDLSIASNQSKRAAALTEKALAQRRFQPADARIAQLKAQKAKAEIDLLTYRRTQAVVVPPISGIVIDADIRKRIGSVVTRGEMLFQLADTGLLQSEIYIPDDKIVSVKVGQKGRLALASRPGQSFAFVVDRVYPRGETIGARTVFRAVATFDRQAIRDLRSGMEGVAQIETGTSNLGWLTIRDAVNFVRAYFWV